jgi:hypothetical protein
MIDKNFRSGRRKAYAAWRFTEAGREWVEILRRKQSNLCFICLLPLGLAVHIDHILPVFEGGTNNAKNLSLTHARCNMSKGAQVILGKQEVAYRRQLLHEVKEGVRLYRMVKTSSFRPKRHHLRKIDLASQYVDLTKG